MVDLPLHVFDTKSVLFSPLLKQKYENDRRNYVCNLRVHTEHKKNKKNDMTISVAHNIYKKLHVLLGTFIYGIVFLNNESVLRAVCIQWCCLVGDFPLLVRY